LHVFKKYRKITKSQPPYLRAEKANGSLVKMCGWDGRDVLKWEDWEVEKKNVKI
jgi:hypothetical protein